jgi:hypothetical protein
LLPLIVLVYAARPERLQNKLLSLLLALDLVAFFAGTSLMYLTDEAGSAFGWQAVALVAGTMIGPAYLLFLSTLDSPLARPLSRPLVRYVLALLVVAAPVFVVVALPRLLLGVHPATFAPYDADFGPWFFPVLTVVYPLPSLFGLAVAVSAFRRAAPASMARRQAKMYIAAFGVRDIGFVLSFGVAYMANVDPVLSLALIPTVVLILYGALLAYGILKVQLFDIDLKIKTGIRRSAVGAAFVLAFLIASQLVQNYTNSKWGVAGGAVAAGLLLFAVRPLERVASRVADTAMPKVRDSPDYVAARKEDVYRHALESALRDGSVTAKERSLLLRLAEDLGLDGNVANRLEVDVLNSATAP